MTIEVLAVALVAGTAGTALVLAAWLGLRRSVEPDGPRQVATDPALEAEQKRLADLKAELAAAATRIAERERQISVNLRELTATERERTEAATELAKQEAALAQRERDLERSLADAERSAAEATARIEALEAVLATRAAGLQQQEIEVEQSEERVTEWRESDWWEKQLGRRLLDDGVRRPRCRFATPPPTELFAAANSRPPMMAHDTQHTRADTTSRGRGRAGSRPRPDTACTIMWREGGLSAGVHPKNGLVKPFLRMRPVSRDQPRDQPPSQRDEQPPSPPSSLSPLRR